ncbi:hypothetical protein BGX24_009242 [Mortierella sp. AD032]|nr:hypothetical protein BGX24_009242 [Mortierella sp. AD032]
MCCNHKRTGNMCKLCIKILAIARVLMFGKDHWCYRPAADAATRVWFKQDHGLPMTVRCFKVEMALGPGAGSESAMISTPDAFSEATDLSAQISDIIEYQTNGPEYADVRAP